MIEVVAEAINEQIAEDRISRETLEKKMIRILEEEGFDSIVDVMWQKALVAYTIGFLDDMREDVLDEVLRSG